MASCRLDFRSCVFSDIWTNRYQVHTLINICLSWVISVILKRADISDTFMILPNGISFSSCCWMSQDHGFSPVCVSPCGFSATFQWIPSHRSCILSPLWIFMCLFKLGLRAKAFPHIVHVNSLSRVWMFTCFFSDEMSLNCFPHTWHLYGFSPVWILMWTFKWLVDTKSLPHVLQVCGFSPVWLLMCTLSPFPYRKPFPHVLHLYCFSSVWIFLCAFNADESKKLFPQVMQECFFTPVWILRCLFSARLHLKSFPQLSHFKDTPTTGESQFICAMLVTYIYTLCSEVEVSCVTTSCSFSRLMQGSSSSSLICGGSFCSTLVLSMLKDCWSMGTSSPSVETCCCGRSTRRTAVWKYYDKNSNADIN